MKKVFFIPVFLLLVTIAGSQTLTGNWEGALLVNGTELTIVFHFSKDSSGKFTGTFDSPKQMAYGLKCSTIFLKDDSVFIGMKAFGASYNGSLSTDKKTISGNWSQGGMSLPLEVKKTGDIATTEMKRPQTPQPPFPYTSEEVTYTNTDRSISFGGTFTSPFNKDLKYPAVILITGSGQQDRDETIFEHKPFAVIADYLVRQGIAVLRVDDRGIGKTTGSTTNATSADFASDVEAGIEYLKTKSEVDTKNIGLLGHSEGGMIAPMLAAKRKDIRFIVLLAAPGIPIVDLMEQQTMDVMATNNISKSDIEAFRPFYKKVMAIAINENDQAIANSKINDLFVEWKSKTDSIAIKNTTNITDPASLNKFAAAVITEIKNPWFNYFIKFDPADYLRKVKCAVLALNGEKDIQVAAVPNTEAIRKIMVEKMVKTFRVQVLPGLNHLFQHCNKCTVPEYAELEETFSPEALQIIGNWIKEVTTK